MSGLSITLTDNNEWVAIVEHPNKKNERKLIPDSTLKQIAYHWFVDKEMAEISDDKRGYSLDIEKPSGEKYKITVEKLEQDTKQGAN